MKPRPLQLLLALTLIGFIIYVYNFPPTHKVATETPAEEPPTEVPPSEEPPKDVFECPNYKVEDMSTLDADLIHTMTEDYRDNQLSFINTNNNTKTNDDAYSIWFDLETLKKFLYHIEKISKIHDGSIKNADLGVRIYYAAYPNMTDEILNKFPDLKNTVRDPEMSNYGGRHTLVMIPTITTTNGKRLDFNPLDFDTYKTGLAKVKKYRINQPDDIPNNTAALSATGASRRTGSRNHGLLYPPTGGSTALGF